MKPVTMFAYAAGTALALLLSHSAMAQVKPGDYLTQGGHNRLKIAAGQGGSLKFTLNARGANYHVCDLDGVIRNGEARMPDSADDKKPCIVTFKPKGEGIEVNEKNSGACQYYCGMRAWFGGDYALPPAGCAPGEVARARKSFKTAYDKKAFAEARDTLAPVLDKCPKVLSELDEGWIRNDLALAQHRAGDSATCQRTLQSFLELAQTPDETIKTDYPPSDAEDMLRIAKATRTNLKLCGAPVTIGAKAKK